MLYNTSLTLNKPLQTMKDKEAVIKLTAVRIVNPIRRNPRIIHVQPYNMYITVQLPIIESLLLFVLVRPGVD